MADPKRVLIVAGETSGDIYAATLIDEMLSREPLEMYAVGGVQTAKRKVNLLFNSADWAAIGYIESIKRAPRLLIVMRSLYEFLEEKRPDLVILVDYPGFNMRLARRAQRMGIPTLYYFPPSKFASSPEDVVDAARTITCVAANFTFTHKVYKDAGANAHFVGHPLLDIAKPSMSRDEACKSFGLDPAKPVVGLCPGSRSSELAYLLPVMLDAARLLLKQHPELQFVVPVIASGTDTVYGLPKADLRAQLEAAKLPVTLVEGKIYDVMSIAELLLISSGTATLEATHIGTPMVIVYKVSLFTEIVARFFNKIPPFIGLPNIILGRKAIPELIQRDFTPERLAETAHDLLSHPEKRAAMKRDLAEAISHLGSPGADARVAELAFGLLNKNGAGKA